MKKIAILILGAMALCPIPVWAEEAEVLPETVEAVQENDAGTPIREENGTADSLSAAVEDSVEIKGTACEAFSAGQPKSTTRVRVTDKACYQAVSEMESLAGIKAKVSDYDFNVIVYDMVDNHVRDLTVRTISQNDKQLCVEITGSIPATEIVNLIANQVSAGQDSEEYDFAAANDIGEEKIDVAAELEAEKAKAEPEAEVLYVGEEKPAPEELDAKAIAESKALIYVAPAWFFDGTQSSRLSEVLKELFSDTALYQITDDENAANYALYPNVNKAKVDAINSQTKRLQMVVSVELKSKESSVSSTEHQNRFVLYEEGEDEQMVAQTLLKKLFRKAGGKLFERVDKIERKRQDKEALPPIITPVPTL